jgi:hypothetical protein
MPAAVTALVAVATAQPSPAANRVDVDVTLFAGLADGRRVAVHERGFCMVAHGASPGFVPPVEEIDVRNVLIPDDDEDPEPLPWEYLVVRLADEGVLTTVAELRALAPYAVRLS